MAIGVILLTLASITTLSFAPGAIAVAVSIIAAIVSIWLQVGRAKGRSFDPDNPPDELLGK